MEAARQSHTTLSETALSAHLQLATLQDGALQPPPGATHALLEIGCSDRDTLDDAWLSHDPSGFLVAFEPLLAEALVGLGVVEMVDYKGAAARDACADSPN